MSILDVLPSKFCFKGIPQSDVSRTCQTVLFSRHEITCRASWHTYLKLLILYSHLQFTQLPVQSRLSYQTFPSQVEIINSNTGQVRFERLVCIFILLKTKNVHQNSNALHMVSLTGWLLKVPFLQLHCLICWSLTRPQIHLFNFGSSLWKISWSR